jgi:hypothetical protein
MCDRSRWLLSLRTHVSCDVERKQSRNVLMFLGLSLPAAPPGVARLCFCVRLCGRLPVYCLYAAVLAAPKI